VALRRKNKKKNCFRNRGERDRLPRRDIHSKQHNANTVHFTMQDTGSSTHELHVTGSIASSVASTVSVIESSLRDVCKGTIRGSEWKDNIKLGRGQGSRLSNCLVGNICQTLCCEPRVDFESVRFCVLAWPKLLAVPFFLKKKKEHPSVASIPPARRFLKNKVFIAFTPKLFYLDRWIPGGECTKLLPKKRRSTKTEACVSAVPYMPDHAMGRN
jgi:hypothetical protein